MTAVPTTGHPAHTAHTAGTRARLELDDRACVLSGVCASLAPHRFDLDGDATVIIDGVVDLDGRHEPVDLAVADAISCCPAAAIALAELPPETPASH